MHMASNPIAILPPTFSLALDIGLFLLTQQVRDLRNGDCSDIGFYFLLGVLLLSDATMVDHSTACIRVVIFNLLK